MIKCFEERFWAPVPDKFRSLVCFRLRCSDHRLRTTCEHHPTVNVLKIGLVLCELCEGLSISVSKQSRKNAGVKIGAEEEHRRRYGIVTVKIVHERWTCCTTNPRHVFDKRLTVHCKGAECRQHTSVAAAIWTPPSNVGFIHEIQSRYTSILHYTVSATTVTMRTTINHLCHVDPFLLSIL